MRHGHDALVATQKLRRHGDPPGRPQQAFLQLNIAHERRQRDEQALHVPRAIAKSAHAGRGRQQEAQRRRERRRAARDGNSSLAAFARVGGSSLQCGFAFRRRALPITKGLPLLQLVCPPTAEPTRPNSPSTPPPLPCPAPPHGVRPLKSVRPSSEEEQEDSNATPKYQQE